VNAIESERQTQTPRLPQQLAWDQSKALKRRLWSTGNHLPAAEFVRCRRANDSRQLILHAQDVDRFDRRGACQHLVGVHRQGIGNTSVQMCMAILFTGKGVEDAKRCRRQWRANQTGVVASRPAISRPAARKSATACSFPGLASSRTNKAFLIIFRSPVSARRFMR
jgi:hypothetical protein